MPQALSKQDRAMRATYQGWAGMYRAEALKATGQFSQLYRKQCASEARYCMRKAAQYS